jgi:hypothetical protein
MLSSVSASMMLFLLHCWCSFHLVAAPFYLYETGNGRNVDFDCLDYYASDNLESLQLTISSKKSHQIIPFCRRDNIDDGLISPGNLISSLTFGELREKNVSSAQLIVWSVPIDLVERYQAFIENADSIVTSGSVRVYNCSVVGLFGEFCHYKFQTKVNGNSEKFFLFLYS